MTGGPPEMFPEAVQKLRDAWKTEGRSGEPRTLALFYFALGDGAEDAARDDLGHYYAWLGGIADQIVASAATDPDTLRTYISTFESLGLDEVICFPASSDPAQVDLLAEAVL